MSDYLGAAASTVLTLLHSQLTKGEVDGLRFGNQIWPVIIAFLNRNPDTQNKSTVFVINRPYRTTTPRKRPAKEMETDDKDDDEVEELIPDDVGTFIQADIQAMRK